MYSKINRRCIYLVESKTQCDSRLLIYESNYSFGKGLERSVGISILAKECIRHLYFSKVLLSWMLLDFAAQWLGGIIVYFTSLANQILACPSLPDTYHMKLPKNRQPNDRCKLHISPYADAATTSLLYIIR